MAGGPAFLRPVEELTTRLCYVPFDGGNALAYSRGLGMDKDLPEGFVKDYCTPVYDGIQVTKINQINCILKVMIDGNLNLLVRSVIDIIGTPHLNLKKKIRYLL